LPAEATAITPEAAALSSAPSSAPRTLVERLKLMLRTLDLLLHAKLIARRMSER
jgi:hypothetical protein